jgi:hypothetical protein
MNILKSTRLIDRNNGLQRIKTINENRKDVYLIHYSCESFFNLKGRTPRIISISIMNYDNSQTHTYSIHLEAQFRKYDYNNLTTAELDECEKIMLDNYYSFIKKNITKYYIHWMMINSNFGFSGIDNRYKILGGKPTYLEDKFKLNLPEILCWVYSYGWESDAHGGRLKNCAERNKMKPTLFLTGAEEANKFEETDWLSLQNSTISKVKLFKNIIELVNAKTLKTKSGWREIYGISLESFKDIINSNVILSIIWWVILVIIGAVISHYIFNTPTPIPTAKI